ncbi:MAG: hypothetical protein WC768_01510 [Patescibacteria group bacterium]
MKIPLTGLADKAAPIGEVADIEFVRIALAFLKDFEREVNAERKGKGEPETAIIATAELAPGVIGLFWLHLGEYAILYDRQRWSTGPVANAAGLSSQVNEFCYLAVREEDAAPNFDQYLENHAKRHLRPLPGADVDWHHNAIPITEMPVARLMRAEIPDNVKTLILSVGTHDGGEERTISIRHCIGFEPYQPLHGDELGQFFAQSYATDYITYAPLTVVVDTAMLFTQQIQGLDKAEEEALVYQLVTGLDAHWFKPMARADRPEIDGYAILLRLDESRPR